MGTREFPAVIMKTTDITDADTIWTWTDHGKDIWSRTQVRIRGIAALEKRDLGGLEAIAFVRSILPAPSLPTESTCIVYSYKWDKYSPRVDGDILLFNGRLLSEIMVEAGYAVPWDGRGRQPKPPWPIPAPVQPSLFS